MKSSRLKKIFAAVTLPVVITMICGAAAVILSRRGAVPDAALIALAALDVLTLAWLFLAFRMIGRRYSENTDAASIKKLEGLASLDHLTGLKNRRIMEECLAEKHAETVAVNRPVSVIMADIDFFKDINDDYGHDAGDTVLKGFAALLERSCRSSDLVSRWGGEEFVIMLYNSREEDAAGFAERLRARVENTPIEYEGGAIRITASFGVSMFSREDTDSLAAVRRADMAMYRGKSDGRNRVKVYDASCHHHQQAPPSGGQ